MVQGIQEGYVDSVSDNGGFIKSTQNPNFGYLAFFNNDVMDNSKEKIKSEAIVHFKVRKRSGKCVAVEIHVIS